MLFKPTVWFATENSNNNTNGLTDGRPDRTNVSILCAKLRFTWKKTKPITSLQI